MRPFRWGWTAMEPELWDLNTWCKWHKKAVPFFVPTTSIWICLWTAVCVSKGMSEVWSMAHDGTKTYHSICLSCFSYLYVTDDINPTCPFHSNYSRNWAAPDSKADQVLCICLHVLHVCAAPRICDARKKASTGCGFETIQYTLWLFNIAMENHHF